MTKKSLKIFFTLLVLFSVCTICSTAVNINLNLPGTDDTITNNESVDNNQSFDSTQDDANTVDTNNPDVQNAFDSTTDNPLDDMQALQPTSNSSSNSGLSVSDIINILLITVGVILILLAIAIMIRLK